METLALNYLNLMSNNGLEKVRLILKLLKKKREIIMHELKIKMFLLHPLPFFRLNSNLILRISLKIIVTYSQ